MPQFGPVGDRSRWRVIYEMLHGLSVNDVLTYERIAADLNMDADKDRHQIQMAVRRAAREYERVDKHALDAITNVGYRVVTAPEHMGLAKRQQRRSHRALMSGQSKVINVDLNAMEPETRKAVEVMVQAFALQMDFNRRTDIRQSRLEEALQQITSVTQRSADEVAALKDRLDRLEGQQRPEGG